jgi:3D (Asp-Asp-Asp) domain-containing protein
VKILRFHAKKWAVSTLSAGMTVAALSTCAMAATNQTYTIRGDETFWSLSRQYNIPLASLLAANPNRNPRNLYPGLTIHLPQAQARSAQSASTTYTIRKGDTFWWISRRLNVPLSTVLQLNPGVNPLKLMPGMQVRVPLTHTAAQTQPRKTAAAEMKVPVTPHLSRSYPINAADTAARSHTSTQAQVKQVQAGQKPLSYSRVINCTASAYTADPSENGWGPVDSLGNPLHVGTIAVDPSVIPLGSTVYITGYSFDGLPSGGMIAHATDKGSAIHGNRIDIFVPTSPQHASDFGLQQVKVYILK